MPCCACSCNGLMGSAGFSSEFYWTQTLLSSRFSLSR